jgi:predicted ATPase
MLNLTLRPEFRGKTLKGTVIELRDSKKSGAIERPAEQFLEITYPSIDLLRMVEALQPDRTKTVVLKGGRGQGKSHMMATAFHLLSNHAAAVSWRDFWATRLKDETVGRLSFRQGFHVIAEAMHNQRYKHLWDLLWDQHPHGQFVKGQWSARGTNVPSDQDVLTLVSHTPTVLILDEFQTWFDGLTNTKLCFP